MSIENPTLAHFRHFSSLLTNFPFTLVENPLQIRPFMQNEPNFRKSQMNVNKVLTRNYEKRTLGEHGKNEPKTNPNEPNQSQLKPIQTQNKPNQTQYKPNSNPIQSQSNPIKANQTQSKPMLVRHQCGGSKAKKCCCVCRLTAGVSRLVTYCEIGA